MNPMAPTQESRTLHDALEEIRRLEILVESSKLMNSSLDGRDLYDSILEIVRRELGVERGTLFFMDEARGEIYAKIKPEKGLTEVRLPIGTGIAGTVAANTRLAPAMTSPIEASARTRTIVPPTTETFE